MDSTNSAATPTHRPGQAKPKIRMTAALLLAIASALPGVNQAQTVTDVASAQSNTGYVPEFTVLNTLGTATPGYRARTAMMSNSLRVSSIGAPSTRT